MKFFHTTRNVTAETIEPRASITEFHLRCFLGKNVHDLTERRLSILIQRSQSVHRTFELARLRRDYVAGKAAVAWKSGEPMFVYVTKD